MGAIRERSTGRIRLLESDHVVGRASHLQCGLTLTERYVSGLHAAVRWTGQRWEVKDLGSQNGTYVDGHRTTANVPQKLAKGTTIGFGKREPVWEMIDDSPPLVMAVPLDGGEPVTVDDEMMVAMPSKEDPQATIYRTADGSWLLERPEEPPTTLAHRQSFHAVGRLWRFDCSDSNALTIVVTGDSADAGVYVRGLTLIFSVSQNEEYVHLRMQCGAKNYDMGARQPYFFLLTLARHWLSEAAQGEVEATCGWLDQEDLAHDPSMASERLNLAVHRIRQQFAKAGVVDFGNIIQRRMRQVRIGTSNFMIMPV